MLDLFEGSLTSVMSHRPSRYNPAGAKYLVGRLAGSVVMGEMRKPIEGASYRLYGRWEDSKPPYSGKVFRFEAYEPLVDRSAHGIAQCLADHVDGVGFSRAHALVAVFGEDTLNTLRADPEKALEVKGITSEIVENLRTFFERDYLFDPAAYAALVDLFAGASFPKKTVKKLLELFGSDAPSIVAERPYLLLALPGIGWTRADRFALSKVGYQQRGIDRQAASIAEALERLADDGHTYGSRGEVEGLAYGLLGFRPDADAWEKAIADDLIVAIDEDPEGQSPAPVVSYALASIAAAEATIARRLAELAEAARPISYNLDAPGMNPDQAAATEVLRDNGVAILAGAPGVGKSWVTARVIDKLQRRGMRRIRVAAPTGKAAKRAAELLEGAGVSGVPSTTIHKLLGPAPSEEDEGVPAGAAKTGRGRDQFGFAHNEGNPLEIDCLIVDETSMVDARLMAALLRAVPDGCRLIFVGDPNQLPSVGPGSVLRDMLAAGIPAATLTKIVRSKPGRVIEACHAIMAGRTPQPAPDLDLEAGDNWIHIEKPDAAIAAEIIDICSMASNYDPVWDVQIVAAQKDKLPFSCEPINRQLCRVLNPKAARALAGIDAEHLPAFVVGDKVCRTKNGKVSEMVAVGSEYDPDDLDDFDEFLIEPPSTWRWRGEEYSLIEGYAVNGDLGQVEDVVITDSDSFVVVRFRSPDRLVRLRYDKAHLIQAYALTCHKCQGSGFPLVIVPVSQSFYWDHRKGTGLFCKELLYTAISRAEQVLITVGDWNAIRAAVGRPTINHRRTRLAGLIATMQAEGAAR